MSAAPIQETSGDPSIVISEATIGGTDAGEFEHDLSAPVELAPGEALTVTLTHTASETTGAKSAMLSLTHDGDNSPVEVSLAANTTAPATSSLTPSTDSVGFGDVTAGESATAEVTFANSGETGDPSIVVGEASISGTDAGEFEHDLVVPVELAPGEAVTVTLTHTASETTGAKSALLSLTHDGDNSPVEVSLAANTTITIDPDGILYRVNAGGELVSGTPEWSADSGSATSPHVNTGETYSSSTTIDMSDPSVPADTPTEVFQSERWDPSSGDEMQWDFPVENGTYRVDLYFAEIYSGAYSEGARVFDVSLEGTVVLPGYDIYAEVGAATGVVKSFETVVEDGNVDLDFGHITENPAIKGIQVVRLGGQSGCPWRVGRDLAVRERGRRWSSATAGRDVYQSLGEKKEIPAILVSDAMISGSDASDSSRPRPGDIDHARTRGICDGNRDPYRVGDCGHEDGNAHADTRRGGRIRPTEVLLEATATAPVEPGSVIYRINAGGDALAGTPGWEADSGGSPSPLREHGIDVLAFPGAIDTSHSSIPAGTPMDVFQSERYDPASGEEMQWDLPAEDGTYQVHLYFAESFPERSPMAPASSTFRWKEVSCARSLRCVCRRRRQCRCGSRACVVTLSRTA
ncbi:MAG: malectin domain-containing carbohydrate-binding protein [Dehalococcoidia bacterium]|nr:malectin domain-containing carbohydrate-binding protein [Dehalococcoidia bacterium]